MKHDKGRSDSNEIRFIKRSNLFNARWYKKKYLLNEKDNISPAEHYLKVGWLKGYNPSIKFNTQDYLALHRDVARARINPLLHYETTGRRERRKISKVNKTSIEEESTIKKFFCSKLSKLIGCLKYRQLIKKNRDSSILVYVRCSKCEIWNFIKQHLTSLFPYRSDFIIACSGEDVFKQVKQWGLRKKRSVTIFCSSKEEKSFSLFRDILSSVDLSKYEMIVRIDSLLTFEQVTLNNSYLYIGKEHIHMCCQGILGGLNVHQVVDKLCNSSHIGVIASEELIASRFLPDERDIISVSHQLGLPVLNHFLNITIPCYAMRMSLLRNFLEKTSDLTCLSDSQNRTLELLLTAHIERAGYQLRGTESAHPRRYVECLTLKAEQEN